MVVANCNTALSAILEPEEWIMPPIRDTLSKGHLSIKGTFQ